MLDGEAFGAEIVEIVRGYVDRQVASATAHMQTQIDDLKARNLALSEGDRAAIIKDAVAAVPAARDGADADPEVIRVMVADAVSAIPPAEPGRPGRDVLPEDVRPMIAAEVERAVAALPAAKDGIGLAGAMVDRAGSLVITLTDGTMRDLGSVVGADADMAALSRQLQEAVSALPPAKDGFGFDDLSVEHDGERCFTLRFSQGDRVKEFAFALPVVIDRGIYKADAGYETGDAVTWAGSLWIAQRATSAKPGEGSDWRLSVKKGRDARGPDPR